MCVRFIVLNIRKPTYNLSVKFLLSFQFLCMDRFVFRKYLFVQLQVGNRVKIIHFKVETFFLNFTIGFLEHCISSLIFFDPARPNLCCNHLNVGSEEVLPAIFKTVIGTIKLIFGLQS